MTEFVSQADIDALETGVDAALAKIEALLQAEAFAEDLPIVGEQLGSAFQAGQGMLKILTDLKTNVVAALNTINNIEAIAADQVQSTIQNAIDDALGAYAGLVTVSVSGGDVRLVFNSSGFSQASFDLADLGMSGLGIDMSGQGQASLDHNFRFTVGVDGGAGSNFYLDTSQSYLNFGADLSLGNSAVSTTLGFLQFNATNIADNVPSATADTANFDFSTSWSTTGLIRDFGTAADFLNVSMSGAVDLDIHLNANMGDAALPSINSDLHVNWSFNQNILNGTTANLWGAAQVTFDNVEYNFGTFVENFVTPILEKLDPILEPINAALSVIKTDLSGILPTDWKVALDVTGDLDGSSDGKVTVLDLIKLANPSITTAQLANIATLVDIVEKIVDFVEFFRDREFADAGYDIGDYTMYLDQIQGAADTLSNLNIDSGSFSGSNVNLNTFLQGLEHLTGFSAVHGGTESNGATGSDLLSQLISNPMLSFPILENPIQAIRLLLGQNVDLFTLDLPTIDLSAGFDADGNVTTPINIATLPILPVPLITAQINVAAQMIVDLAFGYDTSGLEAFAAGGFTNPLLVFDGFFLDDQRSGDTDIAEVIFRGAIDIVIDANFLGVSIGGGGNVIGEVVLDFADSLFGEDGRLYLSEIRARGLDIVANPFSLFDVEGRITAGFRAYVNAPWGNVWRWNSERLTLADFSFVQGAEDLGPPPGLGDQSGGDLFLNIGDRAAERDLAGETSDGPERFEVVGSVNGQIVVSAFGTAQLFGDGTAVTRIIGNGNAYNDEILIDAAVEIEAYLTGGDGSDTLGGGKLGDTLQGGNQDDWLLGRAGADALYGDAGNDYLEGGADGDRIDGGAGDWDTASYINSTAGVSVNLTTSSHTGDAAGDTFFGIEIFEGSRHADNFTGASGSDIFAGLEGDDTLNGEAGNDLLVGGAGGDALDGGAGEDIIAYYSANEGVTLSIANGSGSGTGGEAAGDTFVNVEQVSGSRHSDSMTGGAGTQRFFGEAGNDVLAGGADSDILMGGLGGDALAGGDGIDKASYADAEAGVTLSLASGGTGGEAAGDSFDSIEVVEGSAHADSLTGDEWVNALLGAAGNDLLRGAGGDDVLEGGVGADVIEGGEGNDAASYFYADFGITLDLINGTRGGDAIGDTFSSIEIYRGSDNHGDFIRGSDGIEEIRGEGGNDSLHGALGDDTLIGGTGDDSLNGDGGADILEGGAGADIYHGGSENDRVTYFSSIAGVVVNLSTTQQAINSTTIAALSARDGFGSVDIFGTAEAGRSSVENATGSLLSDSLIASENGSVLEGLAGADRLRGLQGADTLNGGAGADQIDGGAGTNDTATYVNDGAGVTASLAAGTATDGSAATDTLTGIENLTGSAHNDALTGNAVSNRLEGGGGIDVLDGKAGADILVGGQGDDVYFVDSVLSASGPAPDQVIELGGGGHDIVKTSVNYGSLDFAVSLAAEVEDLQLLGTVVFGSGNAMSNRLIGNSAANILDGREGADTFWGYAGNDIYYFDGWGDSVGTETAPRSGITGAGEIAGGGTDEIRLATGNLTAVNTATTYSLDVAWAQQVENLVLIDNIRNISLTGNALNNHLVGNTHSQTLIGGDGNDRLDVRSGRDTAQGGAGTDTLVLDWSAAGDSYDTNALSGTLADGYTGQLRNYYNYGHAISFSGIEHFDLTLGSGWDNINTGDGNDRVTSNAGNDYMYTRGGADVIDGGDGADRWVADKSAATAAMNINLAVLSTYQIGGLTGSVQGIEALGVATAASERFQTGSGNDTIVTHVTHHNDWIRTNAGNDSVKIFAGHDRVDLGAGNDTLVIDWSAGDDSMDVSELSGNLADGYLGTFRNYYHYDNAAYFDGVEHFDVKLGSGWDTLRTGDGNDTVSGAAGNDHLITARGVDVIDGGSGNDRWTADKSKDASGAAIAQAFVLDLTNDPSVDAAKTGPQSTYLGTGSVRGIEMLTLATGDGDDVISTLFADHDDQITTNGGSDWVKVAGGHDNVSMGGQGLAGDTLVLDWSRYDDASGTPTLTLAVDGSGYSGQFRNYYWYDASVTFSGVEHFDLKLTKGNDYVITGTGNDVIAGNEGDDYLVTGTGADVIDGGTGVDRWLADKSAATLAMTIDLTAVSTYQIGALTASVQRIEVLGNSDTERFQTGSGNDLIVTHSIYNHDWIRTNDGNDTVRIFAGHDRVDLGTGNDTLTIDWSDTNDAYDVSEIAGSLADGYSGTFRNYYHYDNGAYFLGVEHFDVKLGIGSDTLRTGDGNDIVWGNSGNDNLITARGVDIIDGGTGNDRWQADKSKNGAGVAITQAIVIDLTNDLSVDAAKAGPQSTYLGTGTVRGIEMLTLTTGDGGDKITTLYAHHDDQLTTNGGNDWVKVAGGHDTVAMGVQGLLGDTLVVDWSAYVDGSNTPGLALAEDGSGYSGQFRNYYWYGASVTFSGVEHFDLKLTQGGDYVITGNGNDIVAGNDGDDYLVTGGGADVIAGGVGADRWFADKSAATSGLSINLAAVSTYQIGGVAGSVQGIEALGNSENERFQSGSGNDVIVTHADQHNDWIRTNAGNDSVKLIRGHDRADLGAGNDTLVIDWSASVYAYDISSLAGDLAAGYFGEFRNYYSYGNGAYFAGVEHFDVKLGSGSDTLHVGDGNDKVQAGAGGDYMNTRGGADTIDGGDGADRWNADKSAANAGMTIDLTLAVSSYAIGGQTVTVRGIEALGGSDHVGNRFRSGSGNDTIVTRNEGYQDFIETLGGNDIIKIAGGHDRVHGGDGLDTLVIDWSASGDSYNTNSLSGTLAEGYSGELRNYYSYGNGVSFTGIEKFDVRLGSGSDTFTAGDGDDFIRGGAGGDTLRAGGGVDTVDYSDKTTAVAVALNGATDVGVLVNGVREDTISGFENVIGGAGADLLAGDAAANHLVGGAGDDVIEGGAGNDRLDGGADNDTAYYAGAAAAVVVSLANLAAQNTGGAGTDTLSGFENLVGSAFNDTLTGDAAANLLHGGLGADVMAGGAGNDTYVVDNIADRANETAAANGIDIVHSSVNFTLGAYVDNLVLTGIAAINGTGNDLANIIAGNEAANVLNGAAGADTLRGGMGDDRYVVDNALDKVEELNGAGTDTVQSSVSYALGNFVENLTLTGTGAVSGTGNTLDNIITGNAAANVIGGGAGNDTLNGGAGADRMTGGAGDDRFIVDNAGDLVIEAAAGGTDTVESSVTHVLAAEVEILKLTGTAAINGTGNALANAISGNAGANILNGLSGADTMTGGGGNDTYVVDNAGDKAVETASTGGTDLVQSSVSFTLGNHVENLTLTGAGAINGTGNTLANAITGNAAANILNGLAGADTMKGGAGNDTYVVDNAADKAIEAAGGGTDLVQAAISYALAAEVENLTLTGTGIINGTGNGLANAITGNAAANILNGLAGADTMKGLGGNDTYVVDNSGDKAVETSSTGGTDLVKTSVSFTLGNYVENLTLIGTAAINGTGNTLANLITGNAGANILNGLGGADTMTGGAGNDIYVVDNAGDKAIEAAAGGTDIVQSSVTYTLATEVENLTLTGLAAVNGTGNGLANALTGNAAANVLTGGGGNDILNGAGGADTLNGGAGNDIYIVDASDILSEAAGGGTDTVQASISYTLGAEIENLVLTGGSSTTGTGNGLNNVITGNAGSNTLTGADGLDTLSGGLGGDVLNGGNGNDKLYGGIGLDRLTGGTGADGFYMDTALSATNVDTILDFVAVDDTIYLNRSTFSAIGANGALSASAFVSGTAAADADDRIVYDAASGKIYYDADGNGMGAAVLFATVTPGAALTNLDFSAYTGP